MEWAAVDAASGRAAQHDGSGHAPAILSLRQHVRDLVERAGDEIHELKFRDWTQPGQRRAKRGIDDRHLRDRRVDHALRAEAVNEAFGDLEGAAIDADVLADTEDVGVALHFLPESLADGFEISDHTWLRTESQQGGDLRAHLLHDL